MKLVSHPFTCGRLRLDLLAAPDLDALVREELDPERLPYWAVVWPCAPALARWLAERDACTRCSVLELGCGAGLVGLAAAALGARVLQTDRFPAALSLARRNALRNGLGGVRHAAADWRAWPLRGRWSRVLASDVTYERTLHAPLLAVLDRALAPGGAACFADPGRPMSLDFFARAEGAGWRVALEETPACGSGSVFIYTLRRPGQE